uniref:Uncharacterized protein n=1 Tax=Romanomermis culicivorax TaxID=13658 RepID=A0A915JHR9_ROMCU
MFPINGIWSIIILMRQWKEFSTIRSSMDAVTLHEKLPRYVPQNCIWSYENSCQNKIKPYGISKEHSGQSC